MNKAQKSVFALMIPEDMKHPYWKPGKLLFIKGVVEGDFGPGNWESFSQADSFAQATFFDSKSEAGAAVTKYASISGLKGVALDIVEFKLV